MCRGEDVATRMKVKWSYHQDLTLLRLTAVAQCNVVPSLSITSCIEPQLLLRTRRWDIQNTSWERAWPRRSTFWMSSDTVMNPNFDSSIRSCRSRIRVHSPSFFKTRGGILCLVLANAQTILSLVERTVISCQQQPSGVIYAILYFDKMYRLDRGGIGVKRAGLPNTHTSP